MKPIRDIWEADKSKNKESFMQQMSFMFFMVDPRSTYSYITDLKERLEAMCPWNLFQKQAEMLESLTNVMKAKPLGLYWR